MAKQKDVLTTGQVAKICSVAPRTVSKWFDTGQLQGYRIPGSRDRRIPLNQLISFMKTHGMSLNGLEAASTRVLVLDDDAETTGILDGPAAADAGYQVSSAKSAFEAGVAVESFKPDVLVVDVSLPDVHAEQLCRDLRANPDLHPLKLIAVSGAMTEGKGQEMLQTGFDAYIKKPMAADELVDTIARVLANGR